MSTTFLALFSISLCLLIVNWNPYREDCANRYDTKNGIGLSITYSKRRIGQLRRALVGMVVVSICLLCMTRSMETYDTYVYVGWVKNLGNFTFFERNPEWAWGKGFELLGRISNGLGGYHFLFFACPLINSIVVYFAIMRNCAWREYAMLSYALYFGFVGFPYSFIILRQGLAISMVLAAYSILDKSKAKALVLCLIGVLFHESAIVAFLMILFFYKDKNAVSFGKKKIIWYFLILISFVAYISHMVTFIVYPILNFLLGILNSVNAHVFNKYILYFGEGMTYDVSLLYVLYYFLTFVILYLYRKGNDNVDAIDEFFVKMNVLSVIILGFMASADAISRLLVYMQACTYIFLIPKYLMKKFNARDLRVVMLVVLFILLALQVKITLGVASLF